MIDIHSHIIFGIDDGSSSLDESLKMVAMAIETGFLGIICTSHYKENAFNNEIYLNNFNILNDALKEKYPNFLLYKGNEFFLSPKTFNDLTNKKINTLNDTNYVLIEFDPLMAFVPIKNALVQILELGYIPIVAHVERYQKLGLKELIELKKLNIPFQINISSINNFYKKKVIILLKNGLIDFIASDAHKFDKRNYCISNEIDTIKKLLSSSEFERLTNNSYLVLKNLPIVFGNSSSIKNEFFLFKKYSIFKNLLEFLKRK